MRPHPIRVVQFAAALSLIATLVVALMPLLAFLVGVVIALHEAAATAASSRFHASSRNWPYSPAGAMGIFAVSARPCAYRLVERYRVDLDAEEEQRTWIEPLRLRAVEAAEDGVDLGLLLGLQAKPQSLELIGGLLPDALDQRVVLGVELLPLLDEQTLEQDRIVWEFGDAGHATVVPRRRRSRWPSRRRAGTGTCRAPAACKRNAPRRNKGYGPYKPSRPYKKPSGPLHHITALLRMCFPLPGNPPRNYYEQRQRRYRAGFVVVLAIGAVVAVKRVLMGDKGRDDSE